eukprot:GHVU01112035.1.p1 GENE.GHVU01112035.1~~GHVU01112035.1.p1  ORF type:complete len:994 (+),score=116.47 GHVU01112035.1:417-2984(+)
MTSAALGELLASYYNVHSMTDADAGALEKVVIDWVRDIARLPDTSSGYVTSGGTAATILACLCAREKHGITHENASRAVVYTTRYTHESVRKGMTCTGLDNVVYRTVGVQPNLRMDVQDLEEKINQDLRAGLRPFFVVGTIGTTCFGTIDPLAEIAETARRNNIWFHCDGAFGGFYLLDEDVRKTARGVDKVDSFSANAHKGLNMPFGSAVLIVRDGATLPTAIGNEAKNKKPKTYDGDAPYTAEGHTFESSRPFRAFPIWFSMSVLGEAAMKDCIREKVALARYCSERLKEIPNVILATQPDMATLGFRVSGPDGNARTDKLLNSVNNGGKVFMSTTYIDDDMYIRVCINNYYTKKEHIDLLCNLVCEELGYETKENSESWHFYHHDVETHDDILDWSNKVFQHLEEELKFQGRDEGHDQQSCDQPPWTGIPKYGRDISDVITEAANHLNKTVKNECNFRRAEGKPVYANCLGNFMMNLTNTYSGHSGSNIGASQLEKMLLTHFAVRFGLPATTRGWLNASGSTSTITAVIAAKEGYKKHCPDWENAVVYGTSVGLETMKKALRVIGLDTCQTRTVGRTRDLKMNTEELEQLIQQDKQDGLLPFILVGSLGSRDCGTIDPINEQADLANEHGLWFHLDASIGGSYMSSEEVQKKAHGTGRADSITMELEGALSQPFGLAMSLVRDGQLLARALCSGEKANYLKDRAMEGDSSYHYSFELSRPSRIIQVWFGLRMTGLTKTYYGLLLAQQRALKIYNGLRNLDEIQVGPKPDLPVVIFRLATRVEKFKAVPSHAITNESTRRLRFFLEEANIKSDMVTIDNLDYIRLSSGWFTLQEDQVDHLLNSVTMATKWVEC